MKGYNGEEIYEGDVVKTTYKGSNDIVVIKFGFYNCYGDRGFGFYQKLIRNSREYNINGDWEFTKSQIIGNILTNPELLEAKS